MKAAQWFNAITLVFAATLALTLAVVCILYLANLDAAPRLREEWPTVVEVTLVFAGLTLLSGLAFVAQRRSWPRREWVQLALYAGVPVGCWLLYRVLGPDA